jgi:Variant SH3 domain/SAM domain (Sterile alpha motif)/PH domain
MAYQRQQDLQRQLGAGDQLVVVHDFDARSNDELTLRKGERIELVELDDGFGDGWFLGRHLGREQTGLFPGVYTTKVPIALPTAHFGGPPQRSSLPSPSSVYQPSPVSHHSMQPAMPSSSFTSSFHQNDSMTGSDESSRTSYTTIQPPASRPASSMYSSTYSPVMQRSIGQALSDPHKGGDSPVMNETLSVIDEHMQDLSTPRNSGPVHEFSAVNDSESEYSSHLDRRPSQLEGSETDDGDEKLAADQVRYWDHKQTAEYLRGMGVDSRHCEIFEEQEITGDVLLDMDQAFIYMKEYDFGVMGRRLKTWHKIRDFQDKVKGPQSSRQSVVTGSGQGGSTEDLSRTHRRLGSNNATKLPRIPSSEDRPDLPLRQQQQPYSAPTDNISRIAPLQTQSSNIQRAQAQLETPPSPWRASITPTSPSTPSAANIREIGHSRRHSSIDFDQQPSFDASDQMQTPTTPHKKQPSLDRDWSMAGLQPGTPTTDTPPSLRLNTMREQSFYNDSDPSLVTVQSTVDLDRGYFSGGEAENRKKSNILRKRDSLGSPAHSRQSSMLQDPRQNTVAAKRHSRLSSVDSVRDVVTPVSTASKAYHSTKYKGRFRSASTRAVSTPQMTGPISPIVTNLEDEQFAKRPGLSQTSETNIGRNLTVSEKARRVMGMRTQSEGLPSSEKDLLAPGNNIPNTIMESPVQSPTGSSTPSAASKSLEIDNTDVSSKGTAGSILSPQLSNRARPKAKKETSAYTRGLLSGTPAEARKTCDYSGWMKKKSSSLITTWKPRLFILRGRRLSYYYSEDDKMERGIIDISGHKVLAANSDVLVTIHAQVTGATSSPVPGYPSQSTTANSSAASRASGGANSPFYFKLVPPKAGISRAVQFTKPTIHFFQVDSLNEGRKWMGEMMKATIEHDLSGFETTNRQKTISLAKARARKERPPALKEKDEENQENVVPEKSVTADGLQISGLNFETPAGLEGNSLGILDEKLNGLDQRNFLADTGQKAAPA